MLVKPQVRLLEWLLMKLYLNYGFESTVFKSAGSSACGSILVSLRLLCSTASFIFEYSNFDWSYQDEEEAHYVFREEVALELRVLAL